MVVIESSPEGYRDEVLKHLKNIELDMLVDFMNFCDKYEINYFIFAGSLIGAVRHHGFIPWDDEIDVGILREDYEKFLEYFEKYGNHEKYELVNWHTLFDIDEKYYNNMSFVCLKNTSLYPNYRIGIYLDLAVLDYAPNGKFKRFLYSKRMQFTTLAATIFRDTYSNENTQRIGHFLRFLFKIFHITPNFMAKVFSNQVSKCDSENCTSISDPSFYYDKFFPKEYFNEFIDVEFEHLNVKIPKEYDKILRIIYGDYMQLPPEEERVNHNGSEIDFGEY